MRVSGILHAKGHQVVTIGPDATVADAVDTLHRHRLGALVVSGDGSTIEGIVSERDVVRALADDGPGCLEEPVSSIMTSTVRTCTPDDTTENLMRIMTEHRIRHLPVTRDASLIGIVSIGDVVKWRVEELESEARHLMDYIATGR